jgi:hypothetical protein
MRVPIWPILTERQFDLSNDSIWSNSVEKLRFAGVIQKIGPWKQSNFQDTVDHVLPAEMLARLDLLPS